MASYHQTRPQKDLFKVVYVCSNQNIAEQNLRKLKVHADVKVDGLSDTRLSMQHLKIYGQMHDPSIREGFVQLIPLTPGTSFSMTGGYGSVLERALLYAIFRRILFFTPYLPQLEELMMAHATKGWPGWCVGLSNWWSRWMRRGRNLLSHMLANVTARLGRRSGACSWLKRCLLQLRPLVAIRQGQIT